MSITLTVAIITPKKQPDGCFESIALFQRIISYLTSVRVKDIGYVLVPPAVKTAAHDAKSACAD